MGSHFSVFNYATFFARTCIFNVKYLGLICWCHSSDHSPPPSWLHYGIFNQSSTTGITSGAGTSYYFGSPELTPDFSGIYLAQNLVFSVWCFVEYTEWAIHKCSIQGNWKNMIHISLFVFLPFLLWPLYHLYVDLLFLITALIFSSSS